MSVIWPAADIARATRLKHGSLLMLQCFFDDSGTHGGSKVVVWGGVVGTEEQFSKLEARWAETLASPPLGKQPLKKFSQSDCRACTGEFSGYTRAESDVMQHAFRQILIESSVVGVCNGVDVEAWDRIVTGKLRSHIGSAESAAYGLCCKQALQASIDNEQKISIVFDQGRRSPILDLIYQGAQHFLPAAAKNVAATFMAVGATPGLQAADIVANHYYVYLRERLSGAPFKIDPHLESLLTHAHVVDGLMGEEQITHMAVSMRQKNAWLLDD